jgi:hypothetical protein
LPTTSGIQAMFHMAGIRCRLSALRYMANPNEWFTGKTSEMVGASRRKGRSETTIGVLHRRRCPSGCPGWVFTLSTAPS